MKILAIDIGTGTQDILLFDTRLDVENSFKLILPSPTIILRKKIQEATRAGKALLLTGVTMGGGPCSWAIEDHLRQGFDVFALPQAARTLNDDLVAVSDLGVKIISPENAKSFSQPVVKLTLGDVDLKAIKRALNEFQVYLDSLDLIAVAVFDHGDAPAGYSDRKFRFEYLEHQVRNSNRLSSFAFPSMEIPPAMTRLAAVRESLSESPIPLMVMDTAPAAVLGASLDPLARKFTRKMIVNIGNFHTLAFRLGSGSIEGFFEHHTGLLDPSLLEGFLRTFAAGTLTDGDIFNSQGHGARIISDLSLQLNAPECPIVVTGPRRTMLASSRLDIHYAVPFGDMMTAGCVGLIDAAADIYPQFREEITAALDRTGSTIAPWDLKD
jgi:uncharacterized protein (DUF1786 family)